MSALARTTFDLPTDIDWVITAEWLDSASQTELANTNKGKRKRVQDVFLEGIGRNSEIVGAYQASQENDLQPPDLKKRSISLLDKTEELFGGPIFLRMISNNGEISLLHPSCQLQMARSRWNCKVIGLLPIMRLVPGTEELLRSIANLPDAKKYEAMEAWIQAHPREVQSLDRILIACLKDRHLDEEFRSTFFNMGGGKVYNFLPKAIKYFKGLKRLSLPNNYLTELPKELAEVPLEVLDVSQNFLRKMPPAIPTLRELHLEMNRIEISSSAIIRFIEKYLESGGSNLEIFLDPEFANRKELKELNIELRDYRAVITIKKTL